MPERRIDREKKRYENNRKSTVLKIKPIDR